MSIYCWLVTTSQHAHPISGKRRLSYGRGDSRLPPRHFRTVRGRLGNWPTYSDGNAQGAR